MTTFDTDPDAQTVAAAWSSSELGRPECGSPFADVDETQLALAHPGDKRRSVARHAVIAAALAGGIAAGSAMALTFLDITPTAPTVVTPGVGTSPAPSVVIRESSQVPSQLPVPAVRTPSAATAPAATPGNTVVIDTPAPEQPPTPNGQDEPEPPKPQDPNPEPPKPPVPDDMDLKLPDPPKPKPKPSDSIPDYKLAPPSSKPGPAPEPPSVPDFKVGP